jgi:hypothetical protein
MERDCKIYILYFFVILTLSSCSSLIFPVASDVNQLELGMSKEQVTKILGSTYVIAEKRMEDENMIEVLSYKCFYMYDEFYFYLLFKNDKLEKWHRELLPKNETIIKKQM